MLVLFAQTKSFWQLLCLHSPPPAQCTSIKWNTKGLSALYILIRAQGRSRPFVSGVLWRNQPYSASFQLMLAFLLSCIMLPPRSVSASLCALLSPCGVFQIPHALAPDATFMHLQHCHSKIYTVMKMLIVIMMIMKILQESLFITEA